MVRVPRPFPEAVGEKTTLITHPPVATGRGGVHWFVCEKSPVIHIAFTLIGSAKLPGRNTCCGGLLVPTIWRRKLRTDGETEGGMATPSPVRETVAGGTEGPKSTVSSPVAGPKC